MVLVTIIWGGNFTASKVALTALPVLPFSAVRFLLAALLLWVIYRSVETPDRLPRRVLVRLIILGIIGNTCYQIAFMTGLAETTAINSSLLIASTPLMVIGLGRILGVEKPNRVVWASLIIGTAGVVLVVASSGAAATFSLATLRGDLLTLGAVLCWAVFTLGIRSLPVEVSALRLTAITTMAGAPGLLLLSGPQLLDISWSRLGPSIWTAIFYSSVLSVVVAYLLWNRAVREVGPARTALLGMMVPLWAILIASIGLGERPRLLQLAGAALILASVMVSRLGQSVPVLIREDEAAG